MITRVPSLPCFHFSPAFPAALSSRQFLPTYVRHASRVTQRHKRRDPYAIAQARARKAANLSRQEVLKKEREGELGDPVRGVTTPFVQSFDTALPPEPAPQHASTESRLSQSPSQISPGPQAERSDHLNFFYTEAELEEGIEKAKQLYARPKGSHSKGSEDEQLETNARVEQAEDTASEALRRISSLSLGNAKDRLRVNVQRCINTFGRHNTDSTLPPRLRATVDDDSKSAQPARMPKDPRVGPDTGSSEVQIAILTARIRSIADFLQTRGKTDKSNKRALRLLVHRRQKLLRYLRRKERGGPRWQHLVETLGLTDGTWKGEISL